MYYSMDVISPSCDPSAQPRWALGRPVTFERDAFIGRFQNRLAPSVGQYRFYQVPPGSARSVCFSVAVVGKWILNRLLSFLFAVYGFSVYLKQIRIKMWYGRITLKSSIIRITYGKSVSCGRSASSSSRTARRHVLDVHWLSSDVSRVPRMLHLAFNPRDHVTSTPVLRWHLCHTDLRLCLSWSGLVE